MKLKSIDEATVDVVTKLHAALSLYGAEEVRFCFRVSPDGSVTAPDYWFIKQDGTKTKDYPPKSERRSVSDSAQAHWHLVQDLGQPRWYMMTINLSLAGKYSMEFEYCDNYHEGDIMKSLD